MMDTKKIYALLGTCVLAVSALSACSSSGVGAGEEEKDLSTRMDVKAYDELLSSGYCASGEEISNNKWASSVKEAGVLRIGGVNTSTLFALESIDDGQVRGFDAGLANMLARYILCDDAAIELTTVTSSTREEVLVNGVVDAVFATYSITDERKEKIDFAGPYFVAQQGILVKKDNEDIGDVDDLAGKKVGVQAGSTSPSIVAEYAPQADVKEYQTDEEIQEALVQGRIDAYVVDNTLLASVVVERPQDFKIVGEPFGAEDPYGVGVPKGSDAQEFINGFLFRVKDNGQWEQLWRITIGERTNQSTPPEQPAVTEGVLPEYIGAGKTR